MSSSGVSGTNIPAEDQLESWCDFYKDFGIRPDFSGLILPPRRRQQGFNLDLFVPKGLTPNRAFEVCADHFSCWRLIEDLDAATKRLNDREPTKSYVISVRDRIEADEELKGLSADDLKQQGISCMTLLERFILEYWFWKKTNHHLDTNTATICAGSRYSDGLVPCVFWFDGEFRVNRCGLQDAYSGFRIRSVVSS